MTRFEGGRRRRHDQPTLTVFRNLHSLRTHARTSCHVIWSPCEHWIQVCIRRTGYSAGGMSAGCEQVCDYRDFQGGLGTPKARAIITSETISLMNECMCLDDDLRQVTIQDTSQATAHLGCSTIAELQWSGEAWQQHPSLCHRFLACTSRGMQIEWTAIQMSKCRHAHPHRRTHEFDASLRIRCIQ